MPEQMRAGEFLPPYYISQLKDSIIISGSFSFDNFRILYAWDLQVDDGEVSSYRQLFTIPYPAEHELKLLGFNKDKQPIVEAAIFQQWHQSLQVFNPSFQTFQNVGVEANRGPSTPSIYSGGSSRNGDCSNCKLLLARIKLLEAQLEMYIHPEQHTLNSTTEVYNDMGKLGLE
ncbi:hypothetical protein Tco_0958003 [Tanacetum coccineum]